MANNIKSQTVELAGRWVGVPELPTLPANAFLTVVGTPTDQGRPDGVYLLAGHVAPPMLTGTPEQIASQIEALNGTLDIQPYVRLFMGRDRLAELIRLLSTAAEQFDAASGETKGGQ